MARIEITVPGERIVEEFTALVQQPVTPTGAPALKVGLVEISQTQPTELIPGPMGPQGPRGSRWFTGAGDPTVPGGVTGDMYLDDVSGAVWQWDGTAWVNTGTNIKGSPDTGPQILVKLAPVDGAGSGLDADTVDGMHAAEFATDAELAAAVASMTTADNLRVLKAGDTMTGALNLPAGSISAPALSVGDADTGLYTTGAAGTLNFNFGVNGLAKIALTDTYISTGAQLRSFGGTSAAPGWSFTAENNTGFYWAATGNMRQTVQGTIVWQAQATAMTAMVPVNLPVANPTVGTHATHKTYVDAQIATKLGDAPSDGLTYGRKNATWATIVGGAVISDTPPPGPLTPGQLWWESDTGNTFLWFDDGDTQQWVQQNIQPAPPVGGVPVGTIRQTIINTAGAGAYVKPVGLKYVEATLIGAGGGSAGCGVTAAGQSSAGGGGGGGGTCIKLIAASDLAASEPYVIGAGGVVGTAGGASTFKGMTAGGGGGAPAAGVGGTTPLMNGGGIPGTAVGGDINARGGPGCHGMRSVHGNAANSWPGTGGSSLFAATHYSPVGLIGGASAGVAGFWPGGGAAGAANGQNLAALNGAVGADGGLFLKEYF